MHCQNEVWWELPAGIDRRPVRLDKVLGHGKADFEDAGNSARHVLIANQLDLGSIQAWVRNQTKHYLRLPRLVFSWFWEQRLRWIVYSAYPTEVEVTKLLAT